MIGYNGLEPDKLVLANRLARSLIQVNQPDAIRLCKASVAILVIDIHRVSPINALCHKDLCRRIFMLHTESDKFFNKINVRAFPFISHEKRFNHDVLMFLSS